MDLNYSFLSNNSEKCSKCHSSKFEYKSGYIICSNCKKEFPDYNYYNSLEDNVVFGYGSLILISSILSRFSDFSVDTSDIYSKKDKNKSYIRLQALINWDDFDIEIIPCYINGFKRSYCLDSHRGGKMLGCTYTGNENDFVNGVLISGLSDKQLDKISSTEDRYQVKQISKKEFSFYDEIPSGKRDINMYVLKDITNSDFSKRNKIYHNRILAGIDMLKIKYNKKLSTNFYRQFIKSFNKKV